MIPEKLPDVFARNLKAWRKRRDLTQSELAERMGASFVSVCNWESGKTSPTLTSVVKLSQALKVGPEALLNDVEPKEAEDLDPHILAHAG